MRSKVECVRDKMACGHTSSFILLLSQIDSRVILPRLKKVYGGTCMCIARSVHVYSWLVHKVAVVQTAAEQPISGQPRAANVAQAIGY